MHVEGNKRQRSLEMSKRCVPLLNKEKQGSNVHIWIEQPHNQIVNERYGKWNTRIKTSGLPNVLE